MNGIQIVQQLESLKPLRLKHEAIWRECFDLTYPLRGSGFNGSTLDARQGSDKNAANLDSTATDSVRVLASSIQSGVTPANSIWFGLEVGDESDDEKHFLSDAAQVVWENIHMSNFDSASYESCIDVVAAGWFALYVDEDRKYGGYAFEQWPIAQVYCASTDPKGKVDTVYREYCLTASQAVTEFGLDILPDSIKNAIKKENYNQEFHFVHAIMPRNQVIGGGKLSKNLPIASFHVEQDSKTICRESGYHEMPVIVPRWMLIPSSSYAVGPVYDALADIRELNDLKRMDKSAAELAIAGMWIAEDDGVLNPRTIKVGARKVIVANSVDSMKELKSSGNWQLADSRIKQLQATIRKILMSDHLQPQDGPVITATQAHINVGLIRQLLGPIYGRMQSEYLQPLIERCFGIAYRAGVLGEAPQSLLNREFNVKYLSPLARSQKLEDVTAIERFNMNLQQISAVDQGVLDVVDFDGQARVLAESLGVPIKTIRKAEDVTALREKRNAAIDEQQQKEQAMQMQSAAGQAMIKQAAQPVPA